MSAPSVAVPAQDTLDRRIPFSVGRDTFEITRRNLIAYRRVPQLLVFSTIQPVIFVLMFRYVFGGAINVPGRIPYVDFLMPGIFVQTVVFGAIATAIGLATDLKSGLMERFHALPMARSAVLTGRTMADMTRNVFVVVLMMVVGFLVGWRIHTNILGLLAGALLVIFFGYSMSWIFATVGLAVGDPEAAQAAGGCRRSPSTSPYPPPPRRSEPSRWAGRRRAMSGRRSRGALGSSSCSPRSRCACTAGPSERPSRSRTASIALEILRSWAGAGRSAPGGGGVGRSKRCPFLGVLRRLVLGPLRLTHGQDLPGAQRRDRPRCGAPAGHPGVDGIRPSRPGGPRAGGRTRRRPPAEDAHRGWARTPSSWSDTSGSGARACAGSPRRTAPSTGPRSRPHSSGRG